MRYLRTGTIFTLVSATLMGMTYIVVGLAHHVPWTIFVTGPLMVGGIAAGLHWIGDH